jgi:hypothetical protein
MIIRSLGSGNQNYSGRAGEAETLCQEAVKAACGTEDEGGPFVFQSSGH